MKHCISTLTFFLLLTLVGYTQPAFQEIAETAGFTQTEGSEAIAVGDYNNDGFEDIYLAYRSQSNQLWQNNGDGTFVEVAAAAGVQVGEDPRSRTAVWADIDNDGYLDLYVGNRQRPDKLYHNNGDGTFTDITSNAGVLQLGYPLSVNFADVNGDGFLDIYVSNFNLQNVLFLNDGDLTFTNFTFQSGALDPGQAMGSIFFDYDKDGDTDLYLVHDGRQPNFLYQNDGTGRFTEVAVAAGANTASFGMGVDVGDVDNDGWLDIYIANLYDNFFLRNNGDGTFTEMADTLGLDDVGMGWGITYLDYNNDGLLDIYVANEYQFSPYRNLLYRNEGDLSFTQMGPEEPACNALASYGTVALDYNLDGQMDLAVANRSAGQRFELFQNVVGNNRNWLTFKLIGVESNRQAVGAKIEIQDKQGRRYYDELTAGNGWLSQNSQLFHFGLDSTDGIDSLKVYWPSGLVQPLEPVAVNGIYSIIEGREALEGILFDIPELTSTTPVEQQASQWRIFPNPSTGRTTVEVRSATEYAQLLSLYSSTGQLLWQQPITTTSGQLTSVDLDFTALGLPAGLYLIQYQMGQEVETKRVLVN